MKKIIVEGKGTLPVNVMSHENGETTEEKAVITCGVETEVSESIYHALSNSDIKFTTVGEAEPETDKPKDEGLDLSGPDTR